MKKQLSAGLLVLLAGALLSSCDGKETKPVFDEDYKTWERTVEGPLTYPIPGHGAKRRGIFINEIGTTVTVADVGGVRRYDYPVGTIIAKENYADLEGTKLDNLTIMIKAPDDPRSVGGWIWVNKNVDTGEEMIFSDGEFCLTCHITANKDHPYGEGNPDNEFRDYVFFPYRSRSE